ncbi:MAG: VCBS repeat-containing protein [Planctomycetota bacterium]
MRSVTPCAFLPLLVLLAACLDHGSAPPPAKGVEAPIRPVVLAESWFVDPRPERWFPKVDHCTDVCVFDADDSGNDELYVARALDAPGPDGDRGARDMLLVLQAGIGFLDTSHFRLPDWSLRTTSVRWHDPYDRLLLTHAPFEDGPRKGKGGQTRVLGVSPSGPFKDLTSTLGLPDDDTRGAEWGFLQQVNKVPHPVEQIILLTGDGPVTYEKEITGQAFYPMDYFGLARLQPARFLGLESNGFVYSIVAVHPRGLSFLQWIPYRQDFVSAGDYDLPGLTDPSVRIVASQPPADLMGIGTKRGLRLIDSSPYGFQQDLTDVLLPRTLAWPLGPPIVDLCFGEHRVFIATGTTILTALLKEGQKATDFETVTPWSGRAVMRTVVLGNMKEGEVLFLARRDGVSEPLEPCWYRDNDGRWQPLSRQEPAPWHLPRRSVPVDLNRDGVLDLCDTEACGPGKDPRDAAIWTQDGDGAFAPSDMERSLQPLPTRPCFTEADLDGDGDQDMVVGSERIEAPTVLGGGLWWWERHPDNGWAPHQIETSWLSITGSCVADLDQDGRPDILAVGPDGTGGSLVSLYRNQGQGSFERFGSSTLAVPERTLGPIRVLDLDGDGDLDLCLAGERVHLFTQDGTGNFADATADLLPAGLDALAGPLAVADLDQVPGPELLAFADAPERHLVLLRPGVDGGRLRQVPSTRLPAGVDDFHGLFDLDGDGDRDLCTTRGVYWNDDGILGRFLSPLPDWVTEIRAVADIDGDRDLDLLVATASGDHVILFNGTQQLSTREGIARRGRTMDLTVHAEPGRGSPDALALPFLSFEAPASPWSHPDWGSFRIGTTDFIALPVMHVGTGAETFTLRVPEDLPASIGTLALQALVLHEPARFPAAAAFTNRVVVPLR